MAKTICMIGAFDTKGEEFAFLRERILGRGFMVLAVNIGVMGTTDRFPVDVEVEAFAKAAGVDIHGLRDRGNRGEAMKEIARGAPAVLRELYEQKKFDGVIGMGGTGGTTVITAGMRALPMGVPKLCVSTAASSDVSPFIGTSDIAMMPAVVDVAGINRISRVVITRAAGAICGMAEVWAGAGRDERPVITATMFGNTTPCVSACSAALQAKGYEVLIFHAVGTGGRTMEKLVRDGLVDAVLDITTTEWADEICGGVFSAGPERLSAPGEKGLPHLIAPGCVDMVNFGPRATVPRHYVEAGRLFYEWNPAVTLMRTTPEENHRMGGIFAEKANAAKGPVAFLIPTRGYSALGEEGKLFYDRAADAAFVEGLKEKLREGIPVVEVNANINEPAFSSKAVDMMLELIAQKKGAAA